jgi:hypothetical protein
MRLNYFGYYFRREGHYLGYLFDIRPFIRTFCQIDSVEFKNKFTYNGENLYLFPARSDVYLFVITRSNEIIKRINKNNLNLREIYELLGRGEELGFASYIYFNQNYIAFASTMLAPRITALTTFINAIFSSINLGSYKFGTRAFLYQATRSDILRLPFIGRTAIQVNKENSLFEDVKNFIGATVEDVADVDSFELIFKPKKRKDISAAVKKAIQTIPEHGTDKMIVKAKDDAHDQLVDLYLVGKGVISDTIKVRDETSIYGAIITKTSENEILEAKVREFRNDADFEKIQLEDLLRFGDINAWSNFLPAV